MISNPVVAQRVIKAITGKPVIQLSKARTEQLIKLAEMTPTKQRFLIGATGLFTHTTFDALNPFVDKETRKYSAIRSAVRMVICTASGMLTREIGQKIGEWAVKTGKLTIPKGIEATKYASAIGRNFAVVGAIASVFLIDVPFINKTLNFLIEKVFKMKKADPQGGTK